MMNFNTSNTYRVKNKIKKININEDDQNSNNIETGFIKASIYDAVTGEPIEHAKVEVLELKISGLYHETGFGNIIATETSDSNGQVPLIELPSNYESDEQMTPRYEHIHYHLRITHKNYYIIFVTNILVFPGIANIYRINLYPATLERPQYEFIITPILSL